ncbi:DUF423 domain-containing protein [Agriterribacter sp.]|uniref:DUF423 domain-containing protein n=1 Tax=Agriterribacter sp. TaxID=2821509 RepID=UPI002CB523E7|nr:DUF423 domain-containing protein [Agriterribacter sp.]HRO46036.1 DUF423 domain-containing protein [Agriterribacter sp.]HRQ17072.1 DUF423 domain-containing protein [Agriterribacter sp.]
MSKRFIQYAAILGALSVALGAFGAHALKKLVEADTVATFETGVRYQFYHTFALLAVGILYRRMPGKVMEWAGILFISGIVLFSGSLYLLTYLNATETVGLKGIGAITPLGGVCFIAGWVCLLVQSLKPSVHREKKEKSNVREA